MPDIYLSPGVLTPFVKGGGSFAGYDALGLSVPVAKAIAARAAPDFIVWGEVIPGPTVSNIARELVFEAGLDPTRPAFSTVLACSTSFIGVVEAAGMVERGGTHLALAGEIRGQVYPSPSQDLGVLFSATSERTVGANRSQAIFMPSCDYDAPAAAPHWLASLVGAGGGGSTSGFLTRGW